MSISEIQHIAPYIQKFPELVRHAKTAAGLTNEELSDLSGVPYSTVCKIQSGERDPKLYDAIAIMQALGISPYQAFAIPSDGDADAAAAQERIHELELDNAVASGDVARLEQVNGLCTERLDAVIHQRDYYRRRSIFASIFSAALSLFLVVYLFFDFRTPTSALFSRAAQRPLRGSLFFSWLSPSVGAASSGIGRCLKPQKRPSCGNRTHVRLCSTLYVTSFLFSIHTFNKFLEIFC